MDIYQILAADFRRGEIDPHNDHVWELDTSFGQPPAVALRSTYGLRAYGVRIYPRFLLNGIAYTDPHTFHIKPLLQFSAPDFASLQYSPFQSINVQQRLWVPDSNILSGETTLINTGNVLMQFTMEWIVQLNPLPAGSPMSVAQMSVNTILRGQTGPLVPVFFLTGGPRGDLTAIPGLGVEVTLKPMENRRFSWALAAKETLDESFYQARNATAVSLEMEQLAISMLQNQQELRFETGDSNWDKALRSSQRRLFQLFIPPIFNFLHASYIRERNPDSGSASIQGVDYQTQRWGVQQITDIWSISRMLPARPDLLQGLLQNLIELQEENGKISAFCSWKERISSLAAAPMLATLTLEAAHATEDQEWLSKVYPALLGFYEQWFQAENDRDQDGWPQWSNLLQTGLLETEYLSRTEKIEMEVLADCAEWPSLAALLIKEGESLKKIAGLLAMDGTEWLDEKTGQLKQLLALTWQEQAGLYQFRDCENHQSLAGQLLHAFKQNGKTSPALVFNSPTRIYVSLISSDGEIRPVECQIKGVVNKHAKKVILSGGKLRCRGDYAFAISDEHFDKIQEITVEGLKKGDLLQIRSVNHQFRSPDFVIPLWAGLLTCGQADKMIEQGQDYVSKNARLMPLFLKIMWLEGLLKYQHKELAAKMFAEWFLDRCNIPSANNENPRPTSNDGSVLERGMNSIHELIPIALYLRLLGVEKLTGDEILLNGFNIFSGKVNVQYRKTFIELDSTNSKVSHINRESVVITESGLHRIRLENKEKR